MSTLLNPANYELIQKAVIEEYPTLKEHCKFIRDCTHYYNGEGADEFYGFKIDKEKVAELIDETIINIMNNSLYGYDRRRHLVYTKEPTISFMYVHIELINRIIRTEKWVNGYEVLKMLFRSTHMFLELMRYLKFIKKHTFAEMIAQHDFTIEDVLSSCDKVNNYHIIMKFITASFIFTYADAAEDVPKMCEYYKIVTLPATISELIYDKHEQTRWNPTAFFNGEMEKCDRFTWLGH